MYGFQTFQPTTNELLIRLSDDYNSWQESFWGRWKRRHLDKDVILAEGISPFPSIIYYIDLEELIPQGTKNTTCTGAP